MTNVVPAIIPVNKRQLEEEINKVSGFAKIIQVDISDGVFTPVKTWPYNGQDEKYFEDLKSENIGWPKWEEIEIELHLMVENPENILLDWIKTGVSSVVCQIESTDDFSKVVDICKQNSVSLGIAIKPSTQIEKIENFVSEADFIQVMGSNSLGRHGVELEDGAKNMITSLRAKYPDSIICIDIGVTEENAPMLIDLGVNKIVSGGAILNSDNPREVFEYFESLH